ncbi:MAG TPA: GreA/GreB family elongation factor [Caulobacteraceae bacterium]
MSRAFVREDDQVRSEAPPELKVSNLPNWVTPHGLKMIDAKLEALEAALSAGPDEAEEAWIRRDLRYWTHQRTGAQLAPPLPKDAVEVAFGARVTFARDQGAEETVDIVGEDEADPAAGKISWASPLARVLMGAEVGEVVELGDRNPPVQIKVLAIVPTP